MLDDEDGASITTGSIVTVSVTVKRRNLRVSHFWHMKDSNILMQFVFFVYADKVAEHSFFAHARVDVR